MSCKTEEIPSNEQIIEELTEGINSLHTEENANNISTADETKIPKDFDESDNESTTNVAQIEDDFVDEEALKDLELTLNETELKERYKQSTELKTKGNNEFKAGEYMDSLKTYTEALKCCPLAETETRSVLYGNRAASKMKMERIESAIDDCTKAIELNDKYVRAILRRAKLYEETDKLDESLADFKRVLELDPGNKEALSASVRLPPLINEKNEKLKTEMFGKLKDLGNMFLRPFGLSTDNFKMQQDPNTGGYSINFQQNPST